MLIKSNLNSVCRYFQREVFIIVKTNTFLSKRHNFNNAAKINFCTICLVELIRHIRNTTAPYYSGEIMKRYIPLRLIIVGLNSSKIYESVNANCNARVRKNFKTLTQTMT